MTIDAVVFDWAGTLIDFGSRAPLEAFREVFRIFEVPVSEAQARAPMGLAKRDHLAAMLAMAPVTEAWRAAHGRAPDSKDLDALYRAFVPLNEAVAESHATLIPGSLETIDWLRSRGIRIGTTTGYTRSIMRRVLPLVAAQGFVPDSIVCADDLARGRPDPEGMRRCLAELGVPPSSSVIKVDDTVPGLQEGRRAGCRAIGVVLTGNGIGLSSAALQALPGPTRAAMHTRVADELTHGGADHLIDSVAQLPALIEALAPWGSLEPRGVPASAAVRQRT